MRFDEKEEKIVRQAEEVGCFGLVGGMAKNLRTHTKYYASSASKSDGPFYCEECYSDAVLRRCIDKKDHFAHKTPLSPVIPKGESDLHWQCKNSICKYLSNIFPSGNWAVERPIEKNKEKGIPDLRPDVSGRINGYPITIEVQASSLTIPEIVKRTEAYSKRKIAILWVVPLLGELLSAPFRPRQYERYFHSMYYGRIYYWWPDLGAKLVPVHYGVAKRHIEYSSWYDENRDFQEAGDYDKVYKVIKTPIFGEKLNIDQGFYYHKRDKFIPENERKEIPAGFLWQDHLEKWWE